MTCSTAGLALRLLNSRPDEAARRLYDPEETPFGSVGLRRPVGLDRRFQAGTYPSGHATIGTSLALSLLLVASSRWRPWLAVAAGCMSATFATGVLFAGWHRPSDALGALAWSGFCMSVAAAVAVRMRGRSRPVIAHPEHAVFGSAGLAILVAAATWLIAAEAAPDYPYGDLPFFVLTALIIAGAFSMIAWYGWQLRAVDWPVERTLLFKKQT